ncbi:MAG: glycine--tRNA ligase [Parcubacteria group bacterium]|jgi:glycyl-tRNA synthetase|nr:glycine--tRNA ligase [Parcubacteria group bacterium]|tara:strand:- start:1627 stop:2931 length:1305 start_codon:yes stop_codon:yes gene_type:complete
MPQDLMQKIISLCKRRGFIYPGSEIYGGLANTYDYGPLGAELKNNIKAAWWKYFVQGREDMVGIDGGVILKEDVWNASGHVKNFKDPLVECKKCHKRFRPDKLESETKCPECGGVFTEEKLFSGLFKTTIGPVEEEGVMTYLRPETAQNIFVNFKNVLNSTVVKIPFGIGQMGKSFRNEITTGNFIFRTIEFEIMELEYFISPNDSWKNIFEEWRNYIHKFTEIIGLDDRKLHDVEIPKEDLAHYSKRTIDMYYEYPFGKDELWAVAYRTDHDLSSHQKASGQSMEYTDAKTGKKYIPHVIEPTFGFDRTLLAVLVEAYQEEEVKGEKRVVLKLHPDMAPYKVAVFPLLRNKPELVKKAREAYDKLKREFMTEFDDHGNIGKRYRRQDEIGTPYCVTVDFDSLEKDDVTVRDRDSMKQTRVKIKELADYLKDKL